MSSSSRSLTVITDGIVKRQVFYNFTTRNSKLHPVVNCSTSFSVFSRIDNENCGLTLASTRITLIMVVMVCSLTQFDDWMVTFLKYYGHDMKFSKILTASWSLSIFLSPFIYFHSFLKTF